MLKLYKISDGTNNLYVFSTVEEESWIRNFYHYNDHGGMNCEDFVRVAKTGKLERISSLEQIPKEDYDALPFETNEWVEEDNDYLDTNEMSIREFIHDPRYNK